MIMEQNDNVVPLLSKQLIEHVKEERERLVGQIVQSEKAIARSRELIARIDREIFARVAALEIMPSDHGDELALHVLRRPMGILEGCGLDKVAASPTCPKLASYWHFHGLSVRKVNAKRPGTVRGRPFVLCADVCGFAGNTQQNQLFFCSVRATDHDFLNLLRHFDFS
jgi:hypothetical protein